MSFNIVQYLVENVGAFVSTLTGGKQTEQGATDFLAPIMGFVESFAHFDLVKILTDFGESLSGVVSTGQIPFIAGFYLGDELDLSDSIGDHGEGGGSSKVGGPTRIRRSVPAAPTISASGYLTPEAAKARVAAQEKTTTAKPRENKPSKLMKSKSALLIDEEALNASLAHITTTHSVITIVMSILSVVAEIASLGQLDTVLDAVQSVYTLLDEPAAFYAIRSARVEMTYERPYRYYMENELRNVIPPPNDALRFLAKEIITPDEFGQLMGYSGINEYYSDLYKKARYIELPAQTTYELLHKGIINDAEAERLLKIADYNPTQIDNLVKLSYDLPNRTEIRVMKRRTNIPDELVDKALAASGLQAEYRPYLLEMLDNWNVEGIQKRVIGEAISQYVDGIIDEAMLLGVCVDNRASTDEGRMYIRYATMARESRRKSDRVKTIRKAFKNGLLTESMSYQDELERHFPDTPIESITEIEIYFALMMDLGFTLVDIEIMLDKDRIDSKDVAVIESLSELMSGITDTTIPE